MPRKELGALPFYKFTFEDYRLNRVEAIIPTILNKPQHHC